MISSVSNEKKVEILNDHYKDTCTRLGGYRKQRNRLVFYAAITIGLIIFLTHTPSQTLSITLSIFFRGTGEAIRENLDGILPGFIVRMLLPFVLMSIAITYKHYRIAIRKQFTYIQMLESELNALYPKSNLFNRETNFSSKESLDFAMWNSRMYSKLLKFGCCMMLISYIILLNLCTISVGEKSILDVLVGVSGIFPSLLSFAYFATEKPLTFLNLIRVVTFRTEK